MFYSRYINNILIRRKCWNRLMMFLKRRFASKCTEREAQPVELSAVHRDYREEWLRSQSKAPAAGNKQAST